MAEHGENLNCESCGAAGATCYQMISFDRAEGTNNEFHNEREFVLCSGCARLERRKQRTLPAFPESAESINGLAREELIAVLDRFFAASGVFEICGHCHRQGTGCCPPTCRVIGAAGCDPANKRGKTVFCAAFICSALLNAISECDPEVGRTLRWVKRELGVAEFHIYEMITRVPTGAREHVRPLTLPNRYPPPEGLENGEKIREKLAALTDEVLALRRQWNELEKRERH